MGLIAWLLFSKAEGIRDSSTSDFSAWWSALSPVTKRIVEALGKYRLALGSWMRGSVCWNAEGSRTEIGLKGGGVNLWSFISLPDSSFEGGDALTASWCLQQTKTRSRPPLPGVSLLQMTSATETWCMLIIGSGRRTSMRKTKGGLSCASGVSRDA